MRRLVITVLLCGSAAAYAGPEAAKPVAPKPATSEIKGDKAKSLLRALKLAGIKSTKAKTAWTFNAGAVRCHSASETEDALGSYDCTVGATKLTNAAAAYLFDAMTRAGIPSDDHMSQSVSSITALTCVDDQGATGGADAMYVCKYNGDTPPK